MYLTRFEINPARRDARRMLASPHRIHAGVLAGFPDSLEPDGPGRVLWRLDPGAHDAVLYIVSTAKPDLTHLVEQIGRPTYGWQTRDYGPFLERLAPGDRWSFRVLANPVRNTRPEGGGRGKRVGHITAAQQGDWFACQAERHGIEIPQTHIGSNDVVVRDRRVQRFDRRGRTVTLSTAVFEGSLVVRDADALRSALTGGIGPGKGYGCGLLTLAAP
ncbi:type I-E CRISPR-associated protein Cas6/Cse3/CasE [Pseudonocardia sp. HH130630-07]|uniref:type I-E CRISPR-associated protein Cas6/Cse3/CasE n=1 Tax=Pseudonocardia sp. HH130630-07 TaxID=1690815 RepID=UPI000814F044|nr:type I-E CRISPR-associated protein Cas6/Cse3/CasE [Pseudonocardia sp. HH130630-07]ANY05850.1 type I-E CRISPR-associated protein Cas6/Cse3/CasE [Pseudonocardia sp. HH130630-07]